MELLKKHTMILKNKKSVYICLEDIYAFCVPGMAYN